MGWFVWTTRPYSPKVSRSRCDYLQKPPREMGESKIPSIYERLKDFVGKAEGLPPDMSVNHDHYLYGVPKRR